MWLIEQPDPLRRRWGSGCLLCISAGCSNKISCFKGSAKLCHTRRHGNDLPKQHAGRMPLTLDHVMSLKAWSSRAANPASGGGGSSLPAGGANSDDAPEATNLSFAHVVFQRTVIDTGGSFRDFERWARAATLVGAQHLRASVSGRVSAQLSEVMGQRENDITAKLARAAACGGLMQDARKNALAIRVKLVLWSWPRGLAHRDEYLPGGVVSLNGGKAPWIVDRLAAVPTLDHDQSAEAKARLTVDALESKWGEGAAGHAQRAFRFFCTDNASDELKAGQLCKSLFPRLDFQMADSAHSAMLVLKNAMAADP